MVEQDPIRTQDELRDPMVFIGEAIKLGLEEQIPSSIHGWSDKLAEQLGTFRLSVSTFLYELPPELLRAYPEALRSYMTQSYQDL